MKRVISAFLLFMILLPGIAKLVYIAYWNIEQDWIEKTYCENIDKPEMECHGKCHLAKALEIIEKNSQDNSEKSLPFWDKLAEIFIYTEDLISTFSFFNHLTENSLLASDNFYFYDNYHHTRLNHIFHPPC